jgi:hypothetical protein
VITVGSEEIEMLYAQSQVVVTTVDHGLDGENVPAMLKRVVDGM